MSVARLLPAAGNVLSFWQLIFLLTVDRVTVHEYLTCHTMRQAVNDERMADNGSPVTRKIAAGCMLGARSQ